MIIDWHTHVHTPEQAAADLQGRCSMTIENVLAAQDQAGIDMTVIRNPYHELRSMNRAEQLAGIGELNRYLAEQQDIHAGKVTAFASCVLGGGDEFLAELERAVTQDGMKGVWVTPACKAPIPTTTRRGRFSSWSAISTSRW